MTSKKLSELTCLSWLTVSCVLSGQGCSGTSITSKAGDASTASDAREVAQVPAGAKAAWSFEGNGTDSTGNGYTATLKGAASYATTDSEDGLESLAVVGNTSYAEAGLVTTATDNVTLSIWAKWNGEPGDESILYNGQSGSNGYGIMLYSVNGMNLTVLLGGVNFLNSDVGLEIGQWTHVATVRRNGQWELWVDGIQASLTNSTASPVFPAGTVQIGLNLIGWVDNARIYERALSVAELQSLALN